MCNKTGAQSAELLDIFIPSEDMCFDTSSMPFPEVSDISLMGLDMGPFMPGSTFKEHFGGAQSQTNFMSF